MKLDTSPGLSRWFNGLCASHGTVSSETISSAEASEPLTRGRRRDRSSLFAGLSPWKQRLAGCKWHEPDVANQR
jgi:hypothetical protein